MNDQLERRLGTSDAVVVGLASMIGAGVFAAFGPAAAAAGSGLLIGLVLAIVRTGSVDEHATNIGSTPIATPNGAKMRTKRPRRLADSPMSPPTNPHQHIARRSRPEWGRVNLIRQGGKGCFQGA